MDEGQIIELFIRAAEVDRKLPDAVRPMLNTPRSRGELTIGGSR